MKNFRNLKIWQKGMKLVIDIYKLSERLPKEEKYGLKSEITRAAVSIPSNTAEGSSRESQKDFKRFLEIALGSAFELETQKLIIQKLQFIATKQITILINNLYEIQRIINRYINKLKNKN